ncbi:MAG: glutamate racemase [Parasporobacterium sp.]|nr:glutamate racemase [Parasporobacterium sp.]
MQTSNDLPVGVFDSGVGGLTVVKEILSTLPSERIIYFGDTARVPYGNKSPETIIRYSKQIAGFLVSQNVKAIVIACNTASAMALDAVREAVDVPVIGVVRPGTDAAIKATANHRIGVIGTEGTIKSGIYDRYIKEKDSSAAIFDKACPLFVNLVEEGMIDDPVTVIMIHRYLDDLIKEHGIDTLILGCTHYPLLQEVIRREVGGQIRLVNPAYETACSLKRLLIENRISSSSAPIPAAHKFYVSDAAEKFRRFAEDILSLNIYSAELKVL